MNETGSITSQLKRVRDDANLSQIQLAEKLGWSANSAGAVGRVERGERGTSIEVVEAWLNACGVEPILVARGSTEADAVYGRLAALPDDRRRLAARFVDLLTRSGLTTDDLDRLGADLAYLESRRGR